MLSVIQMEFIYLKNYRLESVKYLFTEYATLHIELKVVYTFLNKRSSSPQGSGNPVPWMVMVIRKNQEVIIKHFLSAHQSDFVSLLLRRPR